MARFARMYYAICGQTIPLLKLIPGVSYRVGTCICGYQLMDSLAVGSRLILIPAPPPPPPVLEPIYVCVWVGIAICYDNLEP